MNVYTKLGLVTISFVLFGIAIWQTSRPNVESQELKAKVLLLTDELNSLKVRIAKDDKLKLLATLHNENWAAVMNGQDDFVFIERDPENKFCP